ncbi:MAG: mandelate racemase/muconate lactonizing enzyme family protein [Planctomycetes bacterium]|nr:mandelate racemase/muconate lactonizing enzyme family protein [Planctomycetota bacterium]
MDQEKNESGLNRREMLGIGAVAAGGVLLASSSASHAAQVADSGSAIRITSIRGFPVGTKAYVKIETNQKITGWGEVTGLVPSVAVALLESFRELLVDENPTRIEHLWQKIFRSHRDMRGGPFMTHCLSAVDMALWDITGKKWGVPVYRLLGGPCRDRIRMYPSPRATKLGTGGPHPFSGNPDDIQRLANMIKNRRDKEGPGYTIMFDAHCAIPPAMLLQFAAAIQPYDILFLEEVAVPGNIEVFKRLKEHIRIPMATGERDRTIWEMIGYLQNGCIDILQPDVGHTGGISQMRKIATLAEAYHVPLAPHNTCSELGLSASIHISASIPFFLIQEGYLDGHIMPAGVARKSFTVDKNGDASLPQGPGLGVEIDEKAMAKVNEDKRRRFRWPTPTYSDGSVRDY